MKQQPVPIITAGDVDRIIAREFPNDLHTEVARILDQYNGSGKERVQIAVLKLSSGSIESLRDLVLGALSDYRDIIAAAEYPMYAKSVSTATPESDLDKIIQNDWKQYLEWLNK